MHIYLLLRSRLTDCDLMAIKRGRNGICMRSKHIGDVRRSIILDHVEHSNQRIGRDLNQSRKTNDK